MRYKDIMDLNYNQIKSRGSKFEKKSLRTLIDVAKKRYNRLTSSGVLSPALNMFNDEGLSRAIGSTRGISENERRIRFFMLKKFLKAETSTVRGAREYTNLIEDMTGIKYDKNTYKNIFELVRYIERNHSVFYYLYGSDNVIRTVSNVIMEGKVNDLLHDLDMGISVEAIGEKYGIL